MTGGFYQPILCTVCEKPMKFSRECGYTPLEIVISLIERGYPISTVMNYTCSDKHKRAWYIPSVGDSAEVLVYRDYPIG